MDSYLLKLIEAQFPSQRVFTQTIGIPYSTYRDILTKGLGTATFKNAIKICKGLGLSIDEVAKSLESDTPPPSSLEESAKFEPAFSADEVAIVHALRENPALVAVVKRVLDIPDSE